MVNVSIFSIKVPQQPNGLQQKMTPHRKYIKHTIPMFEDIVEYYRKADGVTKNKILCCIFDGKLVLENGRIAATPFSVPVQILLNITKGFQRSEKKKEV
jgi:site-specific DNA recombinase